MRLKLAAKSSAKPLRTNRKDAKLPSTAPRAATIPFVIEIPKANNGDKRAHQFIAGITADKGFTELFEAERSFDAPTGQR